MGVAPGKGGEREGGRVDTLDERDEETWGRGQKRKRGQAGLTWKGLERKEASNRRQLVWGSDRCLPGYSRSGFERFSPFLFWGSVSLVIK